MATFRQATIDAPTLKLFAERLAVLDLDDVLAACKTIEGFEREEGKTAFPDLATILAVVNVENTARHNRELAAKNIQEIHWECPDCGHRTSGFYPPGADLERRCKSHYKPLKDQKPFDSTFAKKGQICGALMIGKVWLNADEEAALGNAQRA